MGLQQGLHAFKLLREYRKLHETSWEPPALLSKPYTEKEIEDLKSKLDERGGSKKESVYDIIKRKKKQMRVRIVQDQKANSIADLAAVLSEQEGLGVKTIAKKELETKSDRGTEVALMLDYAVRAESGALQTLEEDIQNLERRLEKKEIARVAGVASEDRMSKTQLQNLLWKSKAKHQRMQFASKAVAAAREQAPPSPPVPTIPETERAAPAREPRTPVGGTNTSGTEAKPSTAPPGIDWKAVLPSFPSRDSSKLPKRGPILQKHRRMNAPIFNTEGVTVKWDDLLDAEYAKTWPDNVQHVRMGWSRYAAPPGGAETQDDKISRFRERQAKAETALAGEEDVSQAQDESERERKEFLEGFKNDLIRTIREKRLAKQNDSEDARAHTGASVLQESQAVAYKPLDSR